MLEYENQMLLDILHEDGLLIAARGLGIEQILISLLCSYSDEGNLVLVIGTSNQEEEYIISQMRQKEVTPLPKSVNAEISINNRTDFYLKGGCLFVTSRILVVDLLMERVPSHLITGIIIWKAHKILESCQEAFILRLYRQKNKTGFIKAFSNSPLSYTVGFSHVERVMKNLFVKKLYLWPRFHVNISECLNKCKPEVIELHLQMTAAMKQIQMATLDLISSTLQELKLSNRAINCEEFCTENAISAYFEKMIRNHLDPVWHQLSTRTKQLVADLKVLRTVLVFLCQYDAVTFYNLINSLKTTEKALQSAGWMLLPAAETLFVHAKARVFGDAKEDSLPKNNDEKGASKKAMDKFSEPKPEVNPKWSTLSVVLDEVKKETEDVEGQIKCLIVTQDDRTANQLREYLYDGAEKVLQRNFHRSFGAKLGLAPPPFLFGRKEEEASTLGVEIRMQRPTASKGLKRKCESEEKEKGGETLTLTQISKRYPPNEGDETQATKSTHSGDQTMGKESLLIVIHSLKDQNEAFKMTRILKEFCPNYIVMFDSDLEFVRQVEVWQAKEASGVECRVYFLIYKGTVEEQIYLTSIKREKNAFEYLIKEKASILMPEYADGRNEDHPDLRRESFEEREEEGARKGNVATRKGGGVSQSLSSLDGEEGEVRSRPRVIVDMREFRSDLPSILHKRGIDIDPATIEVGDYILTPQVCVERKSISDLIGSLNSGRLYNQALSMTKYYKKPILLIEFDHTKPFHLQGRLILSTNESSSKDVCARLQLLTLHFPHLRLLWSPSPYATAELFHMLKAGKEEPNVAEAQAVNSDSSVDFAHEKFNPFIKKFLSKLPGVTTKNIFLLLRSVADLPHLLRMSEADLGQVLSNSKTAKQIHDALHAPMTPPQQNSVTDARRGKLRTKFGKKLIRGKLR